ncbi:hypothetical protein Mgra_00004042 [Meloidogyne graminicola]|uniref:Uncharacterized protein n=1 Tax=Meloidogyne graminicola TaxID=189291 RepID=A0A8S9ZSK9_9BILA|nr:hypothetical protein Mgra_00004042 [Meloidogyne graminicola]
MKKERNHLKSVAVVVPIFLQLNHLIVGAVSSEISENAGELSVSLSFFCNQCAENFHLILVKNEDHIQLNSFQDKLFCPFRSLMY